MGDAAPPMFEARAMPIMRAFEKLESDGRFRRRGCSSYQKSIKMGERMRTYLYY